MPKPELRTRSRKKAAVKLPKGRTMHYKHRRPQRAKCAMCGAKLNGVPTLPPSELRVLPKSSRRPTRAYGGYLCHSCLKLGIQRAVIGDLS